MARYARIGHFFAAFLASRVEKAVRKGKTAGLERFFLRLDKVNAFFCRLTGARRAKKNADVNRNLTVTATKDGFLDRQDALEDFRFGMRSVAANGCGVMAVCNVLHACGKDEPFASLLAEAEFAGLFHGRAGLSPVFVVKMLAKRGFSVERVYDPAYFDGAAAKADALIHVYLRRDGTAHYVALCAAGGGLFQAYNADFSSPPLTFAAYRAATATANERAGAAVAAEAVFGIRSAGHSPKVYK